jgi:glucokinase
MEQYLGIDVGGTNVKMGLVDATDGRISNFYSHDTASWRSSGHFVKRLGDAIALQLLEHPHVKRVGIGVPGLISRDRSTLIEITAIPEIDGTPVIPDLSARFPGTTFFLENDANAAALGEYYFGEERLPEDYIFVTLGTGVGGAAIIDKKVFKGGGGNAMEPGHVPSKHGRVLERNIGKVELLRMANEMRAAYKGQTVLPDEMGSMLGDGLVAMIRILDITTVLIGGGLSASFDFIMPAVNRQLSYWLTPYYTKNLSVKRATLANDAGLLGAASLCFE